jgi:integrase
MARREQGTGSVYEDPKRPDRWVGEVRVAGKRKRVSGTSKADVSRKLRALTAKRDTGQRLDDRSVTVGQSLTEFLERDVPNRNLAPKTTELYLWTAALIRDDLGNRRLADLTADHVEGMLDRLATRAENPLGRSSLTKVRGTLRRTIAFAERRGKVNRNVALAATITPHAARTQPRQALVPDDARTLLDALRRERNGLIFGLSLRLGLRPGEAAALYWRDVDGGVVNVSRGLRRDGNRPVIVDEVKTAGSRRTIELPADLVDWLADHRKVQLAERLAAATWADDRLVFASTAGTVVEPRNARRRLAAICKQIGADRAKHEPDAAPFPILKPNELRHSCASLLSDAGVPLELIADLLGHASTDMLDRTYRHRLRPVVDVAARATWAVASSD